MTVNATKVKTGDILALTYFVKVDATHKNGKEVGLNVTDLDSKNPIRIEGRKIIEKGFSADEVTNVVEVSMTEVARQLVSAGSKPFTVVFTKSKGEERILRGRLVRHEDLLGRSMVEDLDIASGPPLRQVDHRTIKSLIIDGVKYVVK